MKLRSLSIALALFLVGAAPSSEASWYAIADGGGAPIGYGYVSTRYVGGLLEVTSYREVWRRAAGSGYYSAIDRVTELWRNGTMVSATGRFTEGGTSVETTAAVTDSVVTITSIGPAGARTQRVVIPGRFVASDLFGPGRCVSPIWLSDANVELDLRDMAVELVIDADMPWSARDGTQWTVRRRYRGALLSSTERLGYDGDCHLVAVTKIVSGTNVRIRPVLDRAAAVAGLPTR